MKVRIKVSRSGGETHTFDGTDYEFDALPQEGAVIRFTDYRDAAFVVAELSYEQVGNSFVPVLYVEREGQAEIDNWVKAYQPSRP